MTSIPVIVSLAIVLAMVTEALVEYVSTVVSLFLAGNKKKAIKQAGAIIVSVTLCLSMNLNVFTALGVSFSFPIIGVVLTGIFASRGANYFSDFIKRLTTARQPAGGSKQ